MKKTFKNLFAIIIALVLFIPVSVFAATELEWDDFHEAYEADGEYTAKGMALITKTYGEGEDEYTYSCWSLKDGEYKLGSTIPDEFDLYGIGFCFNEVTVTFDLNGKTLSSKIQDGDEYYDGRVIEAFKSNITITGNGTIVGDYVDFVGGKTIIENGTFDYIYVDGVFGEDEYEEYGYLTINGGTFKEEVYGNYSNVTINGGVFGSSNIDHFAVGVRDTSTLTINGGTFTSQNGVIWGYASIDYSFDGNEVIRKIIPGTECKIIINGGKYLASSGSAIIVSPFYGESDNKAQAYYEINGGEFEGQNAAVSLYADPQYLILKGGSFKATGEYADGAIEIASKDGSEFMGIIAEGYAYDPELIVTLIEEAGEMENGSRMFASQKEINVVHLSYKVLDGNNQTFDASGSKELVFKFSIPFAEFKASGKVYLDDKEVDPKNYTATEGSTIITFTKEFAKANIHDGNHTVKVVTDLGEVTASFKAINNPATVDNVMILAGILSIAVAGTLITCLKYKKREN